MLTGQRAFALRQLEEGLTDEFPGRAYLAGMFAIAEQGEDYALVVQTARRFLPLVKGDAALADRRWLRARELGALMVARRFDEFLSVSAAVEPSDAIREQRVLALLELHRSAEAMREFTVWRTEPSADRATLARLAVRVFLEAGQFEAMERALEEVRLLAPADPQALAYGVVQRALAGREAAAAAALDNFIFRFGGSLENLHFVAGPLAEISSLPLLERCVAAAAERGYAPAPFQMLLVEA